MESVKTAISIQRPLFEQAEALARKMKISRSRLFVIALEDYIRQYENQDLLSKINAAYADEPDLSEQLIKQKLKKTHRRIAEGQW